MSFSLSGPIVLIGAGNMGGAMAAAVTGILAALYYGNISFGTGLIFGLKVLFVTAVGGYRYLHVRMARLPSADVQIALLGHELQHAVEIADAPDVIDPHSLAREYQRIGFLSPRLTPGVSFDSDAAVDAGNRILRELSGKDNPGRGRARL